MTPPMTAARTEIVSLIEATFQTAPNVPLFTAVHSGRLPRLMGFDGNYAGVSPVGQVTNFQNELTEELTIAVQFYMLYEKKVPINPKHIGDPSIVEDAVFKLQAAVQDNLNTGSTGSRWYYQVAGINYPPDPIGGRTRAEIQLKFFGNNPAIVETGA